MLEGNVRAVIRWLAERHVLVAVLKPSDSISYRWLDLQDCFGGFEPQAFWSLHTSWLEFAI